MNPEKAQHIRDLLNKEKATEAQKAFREITPEDTLEYWLIKGNIDQKFQNWGDALNAFNKVLEHDKENVEAQNSVHFIQNILNFWNPEMFNP